MQNTDITKFFISWEISIWAEVLAIPINGIQENEKREVLIKRSNSTNESAKEVSSYQLEIFELNTKFALVPINELYKTTLHSSFYVYLLLNNSSS